MLSFFSRLRTSFTPYFLNRYKQLTLGQSIGYYFSAWFIISLLGSLIALSAGWYFSAPEKIAPLLTRVPAFELQFVDNILTKTSFKEDPYVIILWENAQVFVSAQLMDVPPWYQNIAGLYLLRDSIVINQPQQAAQKITRIQYAEMNIGDKTINNAFLNQRLLTKYPPLRKALMYVIIPFILLVGLCISCFFLLISFFWSLVVFLVSKIGSWASLTYEQSLVFVLHVFLPVFIIAGVTSWFGLYFLFLPTLLFVCLFLFNTVTLKWHSRSTHKK